MRFIYYLIIGLNFFALSAKPNNNELFKGINKCQNHHKYFNSLGKSSNHTSKITVTSIVKIRHNRINLAISEAKLKAKKKLIKFLKKENSDNKRYSGFINNSFNYDLRGAIVTKTCIQDGKFLKLYLDYKNKNINTYDKNKVFINK